MFALLAGDADRMMLWHHQEKGWNSQAQKNLKVVGPQQAPLLQMGQLYAPYSITVHFFQLESGVGVYVPDGKRKEL